MPEPLKPYGLITQTALLLAIGALVGFVAAWAGGADFTDIVKPPEAASTQELAALREAPAHDAAGTPAPSTGPTPIKQVSFLDFRTQLYEQPGVTLVDARDEPTFEQGHIPGAVPFDAELAGRDTAYRSRRAAMLNKDHLIAVYCSGGDCDLSLQLARQLQQLGFTKVVVYEGGWNEWIAEDQPKSTGAFAPDKGAP